MPNDPNQPPAEDDEFFVGYFPTPPGQTRFVAVMAIVMVLLTAGFAYGATAFQRHPGTGRVVDYGRSLTGLVLVEPEPMLRYLDEETGEVRTTLLAGGSKTGVGRNVRSRAGDILTVRGPFLERQGGTYMEVYGVQDGELPPEVVARLTAVEAEDLGMVTLSGEIVDGKCWYGRMKPGGGRTHRPCAQLCLLGGVPPVLITHHLDGSRGHYVLADAQGRAVGREVLPFVALPVEVRGRLERRGDLRILKVDPDRIRRR
ncbi:MAG: hypothetical protein ACFCGT_16610 [Sandaracinaceae bacterium]